MIYIVTLIFIVVFIISLIFNWLNYKKLQGFIYSFNNPILTLVIGISLLAISFIRLFENPALGLIYLPLGIVLVYQYIDSLKLADNGIYIGGAFFGWDEIQYYHWDLEKEGHLILNVKERRPALLWRRKLRYKLKKVEKFKVDSILKKHIKEHYK